MNIKDLHLDTKAISTAPLFKMTEGSVTSLQILANEQLKAHTTKVPALLLCLSGEAIFENERGDKYSMELGDYVHIEPNVVHWINATSNCNLLLMK